MGPLGPSLFISRLNLDLALPNPVATSPRLSTRSPAAPFVLLRCVAAPLMQFTRSGASLNFQSQSGICGATCSLERIVPGRC